MTEGGKGKTKVAAGYSQTAVKRSYGYDRTGNLTHSTDQRTGTTQFEYDKLGRITQAGNERFAFDPAHNILSDNLNAVPDNRLKTYNGTTYYYDDLGNLIHREMADGEVQNYFYDLHDQLVKAEIFKKDGTKETWSYTYDALGRRIGKGCLEDGEVSETSFPHDLSGNDLENQTRFVWDGSRLLQEIHPDGRYTYIYTDQNSYEPLAQVRDWTTAEGENRQQTHYFHCDQIGIPREMTDKEGNLLWFGDYYGWGKLKSETNITETAHQPFRLQNQYFDQETGLHYNFFRYYESDCGRFINQDPIGLIGGMNLYQFAWNSLNWTDTLGLARKPLKSRLPEGSKTGEFGPANGKLTQTNTQTGKLIQIRTYDAKGNPIKDIDWGHDHGSGDPHAHDWKYPSAQAPNKTRSDGRALTKTEKFQLRCGRCAQAAPGLAGLTTKAIGGLGLLLWPNSISPCQDLYYSMNNPNEC